MISKNYIILAHKNPLQLANLIQSLDDAHSRFYIHIDKKADVNDFAFMRAEHTSFIEDRFECTWGHINLVKATLAAIKKIIEDRSEGYTMLLSGQDYPIKSKTHINNYLSSNSHFNHISIHLDPIPETDATFFKERLKNINMFVSYEPGNYISVPYFWTAPLYRKGAIIKRIFKHRWYLTKDVFKIFIPRKFPFTRFYHGHQWWGMNFPTLRKLHRYIQSNYNELFNFYRNVLCADESFFHTIIKHLQKHDQSILIKNCLTHIDWNYREDRSLPITFNTFDLQDLLNQPDYKLFARKFDPGYDSNIFKLLDDKIG